MKYAAAISPLTMTAANRGVEAEDDQCAGDRLNQACDAQHRCQRRLLSAEKAEHLLKAVDDEQRSANHLEGRTK